jgi:hypothetical protein
LGRVVGSLVPDGPTTLSLPSHSFSFSFSKEFS